MDLSKVNLSERMRLVDIDTLSDHPENYNEHPEEQVDALGDSLDEFHQVKNIVVWNGVILAGHGLVMSARKKGIKEVWVVDVGDIWDEDKAARFLAADNPLAEMSKTNYVKLKALMDKRGKDIPGFTPDFIKEVMAKSASLFEKEEGGLYKDKERGDNGEGKGDASQLPRLYEVELGQIWQIGPHRLLCGDCRDSELVEALLDGHPIENLYGHHDPPYGKSVVTDGRLGNSDYLEHGEYEPVIGDDEDYDPSVIFKYAPENIIWGANYFSSKLPDRNSWIVWDKTGGKEWEDSSYSAAELAWTSIGSTMRLYHHLWRGLIKEGLQEKRVHPNQKPSDLIARILSDVFEDTTRVILEFYGGSGSTMIACQSIGRVCYMSELSPEYCETILTRMRKFNLEIRRVI